MSLGVLENPIPLVTNTSFESDIPQVFRCFECKQTPQEDFKMLPCLHLCCVSCLKSIIDKSSIAMPQSGSSVSCSIFSCPECAYVVRIVNGNVSSLKTFVVDLKSKKKLKSIFENQNNLSEKMRLIQIKDGIETSKSQNTERKKNKNREQKNSLKLCDVCCESAMVEGEEGNQLYCLACQMIVCPNCHDHHIEHETESLGGYVDKLKGSMRKMNEELSQMHAGVEDKLKIIHSTKQQLKKNKEDLKAEISNKTKQLFEKIEKQKQVLFTKLDSEYEVCKENQTKSESNFQKLLRDLEGCMYFSMHVLKEDQGTNLLNIFPDIQAHINRTFRSQQDSLILEQLRVEWVDESKEDRMVEKLCGSLVTGSTTFGSCRSIGQFNCGLSWPTCMTTNSEVFVVGGRSETFENNSKLLFFSVKDHLLIHSETISNKTVVEIIPLPSSSHFLLSISNGDVCKYSFKGNIISTFPNSFKPHGGHMTHHTHQRFLISSNHFTLNICSYLDGTVLNKIQLRLTPSPNHSTSLTHQPPPSSEPPPIRGLTTSPRAECICVIFDDNSIRLFSFNGDPILSPPSSKTSPTIISMPSQPRSAHFKCPSHITHDPFGNLLISDFTNDSVSLCSPHASFMGFLLTKPTISCPHRIILDSDNHLYIAQFGGDVSVHHYLSFIRRV